MTDLRQLREIEKLVQDSVFHPSPRHHLRERVLQHAVRAKHRQKLWQRFVVASSAVTGTLLFAFVAMRLFTPTPTPTQAAGPVRVQVYSPGHTTRLPQAPQTVEAPRRPWAKICILAPGACNTARRRKHRCGRLDLIKPILQRPKILGPIPNNW